MQPFLHVIRSGALGVGGWLAALGGRGGQVGGRGARGPRRPPVGPARTGTQAALKTKKGPEIPLPRTCNTW